ncbi:kinase-like domain-containing protein, partial [Glomus cerebriforme]
NPYTLKVLGISQNPDTKNYIIITSYMKKGSLSTILSKKKITNWLEKLYLINRISEGIKLIHDAGYLHCDIHSGNIFYENISEIYISDFGISIPASSTESTKPYGVLAYMAPEILNNGTRTKKSDIYSLGILYWEIITQKKAYANRRNDDYLFLDIIQG